jgi:hypothetical protein
VLRLHPSKDEKTEGKKDGKKDGEGRRIPATESGKSERRRERGGRNDFFYIRAGSQWRAADLDHTF